jgi:hypothetical protein
MQHDIITILIPPGMWRDDRGDASKLHCVISISGTMMHLEAIQVREVDGVQEAVNPELSADFTYLGLYGNEGRSIRPISTANLTSSSRRRLPELRAPVRFF